MSDEKGIKLNEYSKRYEYWTDKTLTQFGYSINLFTTICISALGYLISIRNKFPLLEISCTSKIDWNLFFYLFSVLAILISIVYGFVSIICRLYDFRLTRHLSLSRKRFLKRSKDRKDNGLISDEILDVPKGKNWKYFKEIIFRKINFINENDIKEKQSFLKKFKEIQLNSKILGVISWKAHKIQILLFIIGIIFYGMTVL
jgi:hypothetical protein